MALFLGGVAFSEIGVRGTLVISLYHVYELTGSSAQVGLIGLVQLVALVLLAPLGGVLADRLDRRRLVQITQSVSLVVSLGLAVVTLLGAVQVWHIYLGVLLITSASTFDVPARLAILPGLVPTHRLVKALALMTPIRELALLTGPALGGVLVALSGPGLVYGLEAAMHVVLIVTMGLLRLGPLATARTATSGLLATLREGLAFVVQRPVVWRLLILDIVAMVFGAYRVVLPALARDVLEVGPSGYGLLAAAVPAGALVGSVGLYRVADRLPVGRVVLAATIAYGFFCVGLAQSPVLGVALVSAALIGASDAVASSVRQASIQALTPGDMLGRVSSIGQLVGRGGPSLGDVGMGFAAGFVGPVAALTVGGLLAATLVGVIGARSRDLRGHRIGAATPSAPPRL